MAPKKLILALPLVAVTFSVFGMAASTSAHSRNDTAQTGAPATCEIAVTPDRHGNRFEGVVTAQEPVAGSFELKFARHGRNSATIKQAGNFALDAGETATLGQAGFGGDPANIDAELTLRIHGETVTCSTDDDNSDPIDL